MGLCVFSLSISLVMIEGIYIYISIYHHKQIGSINYHPLFRGLGLDHKKMTCTVCLFILIQWCSTFYSQSKISIQTFETFVLKISVIFQSSLDILIVMLYWNDTCFSPICWKWKWAHWWRLLISADQHRPIEPQGANFFRNILTMPISTQYWIAW